MRNMISGEFYKLRKSKYFYVCILTVAVLVLLLYGTLAMIDKIRTGQRENGQNGIIVTEEVKKSEEPFMDQIGIMGVIQEMFSGHFLDFVLVVFISMFVIREYTDGAVKNIVGKGYSREKIFFSKLLTVLAATVILSLITAAVIVLLGMIFMGKEGLEALIWKDVMIYLGLQILFAIVVTSITVLVSELFRSLAAGISISMGIVIFSTSLTAALDLLFHRLGWKPSRYWILDLQTECPVGDFKGEFLTRGIAISLIWFCLAVLAGTIHFKRADVK